MALAPSQRPCRVRVRLEWERALSEQHAEHERMYAWWKAAGYPADAAKAIEYGEMRWQQLEAKGRGNFGQRQNKEDT